MMASTMLDSAKIQAQVLVPLLRAFREELGTERANRIAWKALEKWRNEVARGWAKSLPDQTSNAERFIAFNRANLSPIGDAIDWQWLEGESVFDGKPEAAWTKQLWRRCGARGSYNSLLRASWADWEPTIRSRNY